MKTIRILSLILALLLLAMPLVSCKEEPDPTPSQDQPAVDTEQNGEGTPVEEQIKKITLVDKGVSHYDLVYDYKNVGEQTRGAIKALEDAYKTFLGCELTVRECFSDRPDADDDIVKDKEILIGLTTRPESQKAMEGKRTKDFSLTIDGDKLVIAGGSDEALMTAVTRFLTAFVYEQGDKIQVQSGKVMSLVVDEKTASEQAMVGRYSFSKTVIGNARLDSYQIVYAKDGSDLANYRDFATKVQSRVFSEAGFEIDVCTDGNVEGIDYKILVGDTTFTDQSVIDAVGDNDYYIALQKTETGANFIIHYGELAADAAWAAFEELFPAVPEPIEIVYNEEGVLKTNMQ